MSKKQTRKSDRADALVPWRRREDSVLLRGKNFPFPGSAASCNPGPETVEAAVDGQPEARAIIASWAFRFPVTVEEVFA